MSLPDGVVTRVVRIGPFYGHDGHILTGNVYIQPVLALGGRRLRLIHSESGATLLDKELKVVLGVDGVEEIPLLVTSQDGMEDGFGHILTNWRYQIRYTFPSAQVSPQGIDQFQVEDGVGVLPLSSLIEVALVDATLVAIPVVRSIKLNGSVLGIDSQGQVDLGAFEGGPGGGGGDLATLTGISDLARDFLDDGLTTQAQMRNIIGAGVPVTIARGSGSNATPGNWKPDWAAGDILNLPGSFPPSAHGHVIGDISTLATVLGNLASSSSVSSLSATVGSNDTAVRALITALADRTTALEAAMSGRAVIVRKISGNYIVPAGAGTTALRIFVGDTDPVGLSSYDPEGRGDFWDGVAL